MKLQILYNKKLDWKFIHPCKCKTAQYQKSCHLRKKEAESGKVETIVLADVQNPPSTPSPSYPTKIFMILIKV